MGQSPFHGIFSFGERQTLTAEESTVPASLNIPVKSSAEKPKPAQSRIGQIAVDIYEQDDYYIIRAPIAGVKLSDLDIDVDGNVVTIHGVRKADETTAQQYYLQECFWGEFSRSVTLPCTVDPKRVKATFSKDNVLKVLVPKEEKVKIVRISEGG